MAGQKPRNACDMEPDYPPAFYAKLEDGARRSARVIVPIILELVSTRCVVDVGCGTGVWLSVFHEHGVADTLGIDGADIDPETLHVPADRFLCVDLAEPLRLEDSFDLVVSLEVAEHLAAQHAETFVESLTRLGPVVLFSAAIPFQGGRHHVNEQWPDYWAGLFKSRDYVAIDYVRPKIWGNEQVEWWYAQNILIFASRETIKENPALRRARQATHLSQLSLVHPRKYLLDVEWMRSL